MGILLNKYKEELLSTMVKKIFKSIIEYLVVFAILTFLCFYFNRSIVMKALYKDDLYHWSWFRGLNLFDFAYKFYEMSRYRPIFETIQYIIYVIADTDPTRIIIINKLYNSLIALFIYHFIKRLDAGRIIALIFSTLYLIAHFAYYQIGQGIGSLESDALLFSLIVLFLCLKLSRVIVHRDKDGSIDKVSNAFLIRNTIFIFIMYFIVVFTHERYLGLALPIILAIMLSKDDSNKILNKRKVCSIVIFILEILLICYIRYLAIGRVMPSGTGGTYVEETFNLSTCLNYCFEQVAFIFGINIGPEHLVGIEFANIYRNLKILTFVSDALIMLVILIYVIARIKNAISRFKNKSSFVERNYLAGDLLFLSFIAMCIGASSVTVRIEMRFVYVSFTAAIIYLTYMYSSIIEIFKNKIFTVSLTILMIAIVGFRIPIELEYRSKFDKIYCYVDLKKVNSIYDATIGKYGLDDIINNKKIYIINQYYDMSNFYAEYMLKIYDKNNVGNKMIVVNSIADIPLEDIGENTIILYEDLENMGYKQLSYEQ